jgi:DNA-binding SARP family transcriptional activator
LQVRYFEALNRLIALLLSSQQYDQALELARHGLEVDAFREDLHRAVMRCLAAIGRQGDAIAHYEAMFRHLQQELGVQPEPESIALAEQIRPRRTN